ncbi:hypothetical protein HO173_006824 [Letharia columbiana]|uniref:Maf-like protein n=1 Tax=Letharia columbiana TaxID=112416 RepID=A0A8H6FUE8_9LECA|nr:uncharacterized protein HO173_006824 [Letharia columbiana]KAF6234894.1 hypothetical protein HO173_006824 [Letharia columbiana]
MTDAKYAPAPAEPPPSYETAAQPPPPLRLPLPLDLPLINTLRDRRVILASASPRRKQLLAQIGLTKLEIKPSTLPENLPKSLPPFEYVLQTATQKAMHVYSSELDNTELGEPAVVLAADTIVVSLSGQVLEKPRSEADHIAMLKMLRNSGYHRVYTAVVAMAPLASARHPGYASESTVEETTVRFGRDTSDEMLLAYVRTREGADKAGGYAIQGVGAILVERIEGSWDNVVGLPLRATLELIEKVLGQSEEELDDESAGPEDSDE